MGMTFAKLHAATYEEIAKITNSFAHAAEFQEKAGYDGIQLHGAHGYLLAQFLSPTTNRRTDQYGGSLENRIRLITEIATEVRKRVSSFFILGIKINSVEFQDKGPREGRFDYVELSGGTYESLAFKHERESFSLDFAEETVKPLKHTRTYITGDFKTVGTMVKVLEACDGIGLARPSC
jgi:2,4-dienoyl-CoA reductase-like NADH-dependent reductase (Old Yellow Enzyme family)